MTDLTCPKCAGQMRSYERNAITIDQCCECRGVFLDRGELDRLIDIESSSLGESRSREGQPMFEDRDRGHHGDGSRGSGSHGGGRRRKGFLGELFD